MGWVWELWEKGAWNGWDKTRELKIWAETRLWGLTRGCQERFWLQAKISISLLGEGWALVTPGSAEPQFPPLTGTSPAPRSLNSQGLPFGCGKLLPGESLCCVWREPKSSIFTFIFYLGPGMSKSASGASCSALLARLGFVGSKQSDFGG